MSTGRWSSIALDQVLDLLKNGTTAEQNKAGRGYRVTRIETISSDAIDINRVGWIENIEQDSVERYRLRRGDILFSHINSEPQLGRTAIVESEEPVVLHGMNLLLLRFNQKADPWFMHFCLSHLRREGVFIGVASRAVGQSSINQGKLRAVEVPLPPLDEQRAIADVLRAAQETIRSHHKLTTTSEDLRASLLDHIVDDSIPAQTLGDLLESGVISEIQDGNHGEKHRERTRFCVTDSGCVA